MIGTHHSNRPDRGRGQKCRWPCANVCGGVKADVSYEKRTVRALVRQDFKSSHYR